MNQVTQIGRVFVLAVLSLVACLVTSAGAYAQFAPARDVTVELKGQKIVRLADGKESRESAAQAKPGDVIEYTATYTNRSKTAVKNVAATLPIPNETEYVAASAQPAGAQAALIDGVYQAMPLKRQVKLANGAVETRDVPLAEYRTLRWQVGELAPGKDFVASARVRVSATPITVPAAPAAPAKK
jgi:uncharacterized repeat protein (TIGR01451 family)